MRGKTISKRPKIAFVTNLCTHYNAGLFEQLATRLDVDFYFYSPGGEWYWNHDLASAGGSFRSYELPGLALGHTRVTPTLAVRLFRGGYDAYIKCINGKFALPVTYLAARLRGRPFILRTGIWRRLATPLQRLLWPLTRYLYHHADALVVYGEHVKQYLIKEGVRPERIFIAPHAVDNFFYGRRVSQAEKDGLRSRLGIARDQKVVLYVGRLTAIKGCSFLLQAFASLRRQDAVLVLAGSGEQGEELQQMARQSGATVKFAGPVPWQEIVPYYAIAYVSVLPSIVTRREKETWGLVVNEAFNQAAPVIATAAVGAAAGDLLKDGVNGLVVAEADVAALAAALDRILSDERLRERMGRSAAACIGDWTQERMADAFAQAVDYALGANLPRVPEPAQPARKTNCSNSANSAAS